MKESKPGISRIVALAILATVFPLSAIAAPPELEAAETSRDGVKILRLLKAEAEKQPSMRFKLKQVSSLGGAVKTGSSSEKATETLEGTYSLGPNGKLRIEFKKTANDGRPPSDGFVVSNGSLVWSSFRPTGGSIAYVAKRPVGFQEEITKALVSMRPELAGAADRKGCSYGNYLVDAESGAPELPSEVLKAVQGRDVVFVSSEVSDKEKIYTLRLPSTEGCSRVDFSVSERGLVKKVVVFNPYTSGDEILGSQELYDFETNPSFDSSTFTYNETSGENIVIDLSARKNETIEMMRNTLARPPERIFSELFAAEARTVRGLRGVGTVWFTYEYAIRFEADELPAWREKLVRSAGDVQRQREFFAAAFKDEATSLAAAKRLTASHFDTGKEHRWVLHDEAAKIFYVRAWGDE